MFVSDSQIDFSALEGSTLIIPSISLGNVPQLTVDLLIETLKLKRIGIWDTFSLIPVAGPAAYSHQTAALDFSFNGEVYFDPEHHLTLMQFRAPIIQGMMANFVNELFEVIGLYKFDHVVILSSYDMTLRVDSQIQDSNLRWLCHSRSLAPSVILPSEIKQLELEMEGAMPSPTEGEQLPHLPGSGFTRKFLLLAQKKSFDNAVALFAFVSEGDNRIDASLLASFLDGILHLKSAKNGWKPPPSWNMLFGSEIASGLYN
ncbi:hypothetical protein DSO57_1005304 [Entomophthora muscae]|uniref:Uncharacterized protein n=1 Tax=Entomophthora muscae TaxID=34485 RepID=A0ACC2UHE3_9FUNG|nr:hypothetical protein DSO57_1005304 [Entomophthora muscae]